MLIRPFLSGQAFDPETIDKMSQALKGVCETLSLKLMDGPENSSCGPEDHRAFSAWRAGRCCAPSNGTEGVQVRIASRSPR